MLITSSDGFKVLVSLVSADESATADPANPAPPGLTNLVLRLNEHNVQTDRRAQPFPGRSVPPAVPTPTTTQATDLLGRTRTLLNNAATCNSIPPPPS